MARTRQIPIPNQSPAATFGLGGVSSVDIEPRSAPGLAGVPQQAPYSPGQFDRMHGAPTPPRMPRLTPDFEDFTPDGDNTANPGSQSPAAILHAEFIMRLQDFRTDAVALANLGDTIIPPDAELAKMKLGELRTLLTQAGYQSPLPTTST